MVEREEPFSRIAKSGRLSSRNQAIIGSVSAIADDHPSTSREANLY